MAEAEDEYQGDAQQGEGVAQHGGGDFYVSWGKVTMGITVSGLTFISRHYAEGAGHEVLPKFVVLRGVFKPYGAQLFY